MGGLLPSPPMLLALRVRPPWERFLQLIQLRWPGPGAGSSAHTAGAGAAVYSLGERGSGQVEPSSVHPLKSEGCIQSLHGK